MPKRIYLIVLNCIIIYSAGLSQHYIKLLDEQNLFNQSIPSDIALDKNNIWLVSQKVSTNISDLVKIQFNGHIKSVFEIENNAVTIGGFKQYNNQLWIYGQDLTSLGESIRLSSFDKTSEILNSVTFSNYNFDEISALRMDINSSSLFLSYLGKVEDSNISTTHVKRVNFEGGQIWDKAINVPALRTFNAQILAKENEIVLVSGVSVDFQRPTQIVKINDIGNRHWSNIDVEGIVNDGNQRGTCYLDDGDIITSSRVDRDGDIEYFNNNWYPRPYKFTWLDSNGVTLMDTIYNTPFGNNQVIWNLEKGNGDYFFGYGAWTDPETDFEYAWIFKISNGGEIIWDRKYRLKEYDNDQNYSIRSLKEDSNNDIIAVGYLIDEGPKTFLIKADENGCINDKECGDMIVKTDEAAAENKSLLVYPNPVSDNLTLSFGSAKTFNVHIYDFNGRTVFLGSTDDGKVDVSNHSQGIYFINAESNGIKYQSTFFKR